MLCMPAKMYSSVVCVCVCVCVCEWVRARFCVCHRSVTQICPIDFHQKLVLYCPYQLKLIIFIWISTNFWHILLHINICTNDALSRKRACCHNRGTVLAFIDAVVVAVIATTSASAVVSAIAVLLLFSCFETVSSTATPTDVI